MARPTKQGIDYFPIDCQFDDKIEMYLIEKGGAGLGVLVTLWQMIYANEGYYITNNRDLHLLIKKRIDIDINEVSDCINVCLSRCIFDKSIHKKYEVLTSKAIQKRYFDAAKKKKSVSVCVDYLIKGIDSCDNWVNVSGNATNVNVEEDVKEKVLDPLSSNLDDEAAKRERAIKAQRREDAIKMLTVLNNMTGKNFRFVDTNIDPIIQRLKSGIEVNQIHQMIGYKVREWKDDDKMVKFLRPATLFSRTNCEQYIGEMK